MINKARFLHFGTLFCLFLVSLPAGAQNPPYDVFPDAEAPYYRVRYEASTEPGKLIFPVKYTVWIPPQVKTLRGLIVHQHGCGEGSCKSGLTGAFDLHWQALAAKHGCALMAPSYEQPQKADCQMWCDPRNGSADAFLQSLVDLGKLSGHAELAEVPWALWGHSGGGHWAGGMTMLYPDRVAATWLRSGVPMLEVNPDRPGIKPHQLPKAALSVPVMCNPGTKEGVTVKDGRFARVWPANEAFFYRMRGEGALIGISVDPLTAHECGNQRYMAIPWLDECLAKRLAKGDDQTLRPMPTDEVYLATVLETKPVAEKQYNGDAAKAIWLPSQRIAQQWSQYVTDTKIADNTPPPAVQQVSVKDGVLTWQPQADLESGISHFLIQHQGKTIGQVPETPANRFGRPLFQGLQYSDTPDMPLVEAQFELPAELASGASVTVITVNTVGGKSEPAGLAR